MFKGGMSVYFSKKTIIITSIAFLVISTSIIVPLVVLLRPPKLVDHDPIVIWSDADFELYNFPGKGTKISPYIIKKYNITTNSKIGIVIRDTTKHFVIKNCYINADEIGILINFVGEGTARIENNDIVDCNVQIEDCLDFILADNTCIWGDILVESCFDFVVRDNTCTNGGISFTKCFDFISSDNTCINNGFWVSSCARFTISNNDITSSGDGIWVYECEDFILSQNTLNFNSFGITVRRSYDGEIRENNCKNSFIEGIDISNCGFLSLIGNTLFNSSITLRSNYNVTVKENDISIGGIDYAPTSFENCQTLPLKTISLMENRLVILWIFKILFFQKQFMDKYR